MLYDPKREWLRKGICRFEDARLFFADGGPCSRPPGPKVQAKWDQAKEICMMCPVRKECARDTLGESYGVWGGLDQFQRHRLRTALYSAVKRWPRGRQLAWGRKLAELRDADTHYKEIQTMTGMTPACVDYLTKIWEEFRPKEVEPQAEVVDLPLPEPEAEQQPFPERAGRKNCWVRQNGLISDAYYTGQTSDGVWIKVQLSERASRYRWLPAEDVHMYHPQPVIVLDYIGRPDRGDHDLSA